MRADIQAVIKRLDACTHESIDGLDNEKYHMEYDMAVFERLQELDSEFFEALEYHRQQNDVSFWYA